VCDRAKPHQLYKVEFLFIRLFLFIWGNLLFRGRFLFRCGVDPSPARFKKGGL